MKPLATGLLPAGLALKWLMNQPIACAVPGATTISEAEENALVGHGALALSAGEMEEASAERAYWDHRRCRICGECLPCPADVRISVVLGTDVMYDHYRTMGLEAFDQFAWSRDAVRQDLKRRRETVSAIEACTDCGVCEERCPHGLPIREMLAATVPGMRDMISAYERFLSL
jgi:predicted aldo/keto reductase-like oxidoreductase